MMKATLGRTGLVVNKDGFGALPVQRRSFADGVKLIRAAYEGGIDFFDTARAYTDSEEKLGAALGDVRRRVVLASKTQALTPEKLWEDLHTSLACLQTDVIDVYQLHNAAQCYAPGDGTGLYEALQEAKKQGKIRYIGLTSHKLALARQAVESGLYDTLQYPFCYLSSDEEAALVRLCAQNGVGFIAMKALSGGLITDIGAARAWQAQFENAVPIWGLQTQEELAQLLAQPDAAGGMTAAAQARIKQDRAELQGNFCRGCGYCAPCPVGIEIHTCARMSLLLRRSPTQSLLGEEGQRKMAKIDECLHCGQCAGRCPYGLNPPQLLAQNRKEYLEEIESIHK